MHSCSTKKNTAITRLYHNTTSHFNILFNGSEGYKRGLKTIRETSEDYTLLLPIYKEEREDIKSAVSGDMDEAIKKSVKMIKMHSITEKPKRKAPKKGKKGYKLTQKQKDFYNKKEYNKWVDDAYLLMGKAHYYKGDYAGAMRSLHLILNKFRKEEVKFYALYWIARSQLAQKNFKEAESYLKLITEDKTHPEELNFDIDMAYADIFIKKKKYDKALEKLDFLIGKIRKKKDKARLKYLTAQIYQKTNNGTKAIKLFEEVVKMNPPYEMIFNAKINMAKSFINSSENSEKIRKILAKMLKDVKNVDFLDQIYYVLAGIEFKENNENKAIEYYKQSVAKSVSNNNQKALSYLSLADIYFSRRSYLPAGDYYDSTMSVLNRKYPEYDLISKKARNLKELTDNLKLINREDSLQRVAAMDSVARNAYIQAIINKLIADERAEQNVGRTFNNDPFNRGDYSQNPSRGKWYFYNPQSVSIGKSEFLKIWGKRKLEDHWRRRNKDVISDEFEDDENNNDESDRITDNKKIEYYLQDLPLTDSLVQLSNDRIVKAYFDAGVVYERKMNDYPEAEKSYKKLIQRFPENNLKIESYFNLYMLNYKHIKNKSEAEKYRNKILTEYPYSKYAKILSDPNYLVKLQQNKDKIDKIYSEAYSFYKQKKYQKVINKTKEAFEISKDNHLNAKLFYLKAKSYGNLGDLNEMKTIFENIVKEYPRDEVTPLSQDVLDLLASGKYDPNYYSTKKDSVYFYSVVTDKGSKYSNKIKYILTTHNVSAFPKEKLKVELKDLGENKTIISVKPFKNFSKVSSYMNSINGKYKEIPISDYTQFTITEENLQKLQELPILEKYMKFYKTHN